MKQLFLISSTADCEDLENLDALPVSERLIPELSGRFQGFVFEDQISFHIPPSDALDFLRQFYERYELSQPQRRVWARFQKVLGEMPRGGYAKFVAAEVSAHRSRRKAKKS